MPALGLHGLEAIELQIVAVLLIFSVVAVIARRYRFPYTVALVVVGLSLSLQPGLGETVAHLVPTSEIILALFLPPLLFEAALHLRVSDLRRDVAPLMILALPGLLVSTAIVGGYVAALGFLSLGTALLFGALISATDPVAVVATFRAFGAPRRLTTLVEGESLFNDGAAIVLFGVMLELALGEPTSVSSAAASLALVSLGGLGIGLVLGALSNAVIAHIDDHLVETTVTTVLCYGSFLVAEAAGVSGVLAVVMAGIVKAEGGPRGMSPTTRIVLFSFWEYAAFVANSFLFLLIGLSVNIDLLADNLIPVLLVVVGVVATRGLVVYAAGGALRALRRPLPTRYQHMLVWGGLRGAVGIALALSLPAALGERDDVLAMTFGVVLFTLLVQATTVPTALRRLGFARRDEHMEAYQRLQGQLVAARLVRRHIDELEKEGAVPRPTAAIVESELESRALEAQAGIERLLAERPAVRRGLVGVVREEALWAERAAIGQLERDGVITRQVAEHLQADVDARIATHGSEHNSGASAMGTEEEAHAS